MKPGFWAAVFLGALGLASMLFSPVLGFMQAVVFFAAAWGIRRGRPWAAMAAVAMVVAPVLAILLQAIGRGEPVRTADLAISGLVLAVVAALLARAAIVLFRRRGAGFLAGNDWAVAVFIVLVFLVCFSIRPYVMPTGSMANTILAGDYILVDVVSPALRWTPKHNDLVVFRSPADPKQTFIKRVIGVPGDRIRIRRKQVLLNGTPVREPWAIHRTSYIDTYRDNFPDGTPPLKPYPPAEVMLADNVRGGEVVVPEGKLFVLGDDRDNSLDSRYFGFVPRENVAGRPLLIYGSFAPEGENLAADRLPNLRRARWNRTFKPL